MTRRTDRDAFRKGYRDAMLWANTYRATEDEYAQNGNLESLHFGTGDASEQCARYARRLHPSATAQMREDCALFLDYAPDDSDPATCEALIGRAIAESAGRYSFAQAGHDYALTRNHHGAGFWDRGIGEVGETLTSASDSYGEASLYLAEDGRIYSE